MLHSVRWQPTRLHKPPTHPCNPTRLQAMAADYGFRAGAGRLYEEHYGEVPSSVVQLVRAAS